MAVSEFNSDLPSVMDTTSAVVIVEAVPHNKEIAGWPRNAVVVVTL